MKIYVAASTADVDRAERLIRLCREAGHEITYDWTKMVREYGRGDADETPIEVLSNAADLDRQGVRDCELFILLWHEKVFGALIELGMALELDKQVWLVERDDSKFSVFYCFEDNPVRKVYPFEVGQELKYGSLR